MSDADKIAEGAALYRFLTLGEIIVAGDECPSDDGATWEPVNKWAVGSPVRTIYKTMRRRVSVNEALLAAEARGYAAAREQAVEAVEEVKRIYVDASNANSAGPLLDEAAEAIRKMEPNT